MAQQTRDTLKGWFVTEAIPTQQQFWDVFDSFFHRGDGLTIANVEGLLSTLQNKVDKTQFDALEQGHLIAFNDNATYAIPASSLLEMVMPFYGESGTMKMSIVQHGDEDIMPEMPLDAGWNKPISLNIVAEEETTLFISGIPNGSKLIFFKRKFKMI